MKKHELGRSMIEMLGVLAIIGTLSIAVAWGYNTALSRLKANETINDVMLRATNVPMVDEMYMGKTAPHEWTFPDLSANEGRVGHFYTMETRADKSTGFIYKVEVFSVYKTVCERLLVLKPRQVDAVYVKESSIEDYIEDHKFTGTNGTDLCDNEENTIAFYFDGEW